MSYVRGGEGKKKKIKAKPVNRDQRAKSRPNISEGGGAREEPGKVR